MNIEIKEKLPSWYKNLEGKKAILTGDIDSLMAYYFLHKLFNIVVGGFYNFKNIYKVGTEWGKTFGIDMDTIQGHTFGNHLTHFYKNENAINLNNVVGNIKYYQKFPLSTTILICSLYDIDLESMTDEQLKIILAIDVGFKGYYSDFFKPHYLKWLDRLGYRFLEDRILKKHTIDEMYQVIKKYGLHESIRVNAEGHLQTKIKLDEISEVFGDIIALPTDKFNLHKSYTYKVINPEYQAVPPRDEIISMAWTKKSELKLTIK